MTNEQINRAIAEAYGWTDCNEYIGKPPILKMDQYNRSFPNYAECLNAMHEAEKTLNPIKAAEYARMLTSIAWQSEQPVFAPMTATARQRAEAFLRTIGKWEEEA
jgi:hypothetical protein